MTAPERERDPGPAPRGEGETWPASKDEEIRMLRDQMARMKAQWIDWHSHGLHDGPRDTRRNAVAANWDADYPFVISADVTPIPVSRGEGVGIISWVCPACKVTNMGSSVGTCKGCGPIHPNYVQAQSVTVSGVWFQEHVAPVPDGGAVKQKLIDDERVISPNKEQCEEVMRYLRRGLTHYFKLDWPEDAAWLVWDEFWAGIRDAGLIIHMRDIAALAASAPTEGTTMPKCVMCRRILSPSESGICKKCLRKIKSKGTTT